MAALKWTFFYFYVKRWKIQTVSDNSFRVLLWLNVPSHSLSIALALLNVEALNTFSMVNFSAQFINVLWQKKQTKHSWSVTFVSLNVTYLQINHYEQCNPPPFLIHKGSNHRPPFPAQRSSFCKHHFLLIKSVHKDIKFRRCVGISNLHKEQTIEGHTGFMLTVVWSMNTDVEWDDVCTQWGNRDLFKHIYTHQQCRQQASKIDWRIVMKAVKISQRHERCFAGLFFI